jgi:hypothetical protein
MTAPQDEAVSSRQGAWHQSTLSTIHDCPRRWFLTYQCGLPDPSGEAARVGTGIHAAVELHEKARMEGKVLPSMDDMVDAAIATLGEEEYELHDKAEAGIKHWWKTKMKDKGVSHRDWVGTMEPVAIEPYFRVDLVEGALPVAGWIDAVYKDEVGIYRLVDLKTAGSMSRWKDDGEGKRHQATMYAVALQLSNILPEPIDYLPEMTYTVVKPGTGGECAKRVSVQPDLADVAVLGQKIRDAEAMVVADAFPRNPSWVLCSQQWCPHYERCMITGEYAGRPVTVRQRLAVPSVAAPLVQSSIVANNTDTIGGINHEQQ